MLQKMCVQRPPQTAQRGPMTYDEYRRKGVPEEVLEPLVAAVTEYESAMNTSISGEQMVRARQEAASLQFALRRLKLLTVIRLARGARDEMNARGYLNAHQGAFVFPCVNCRDGEITEVCQFSGCDLG